MAGTITAKPNQSMSDVILMACGSMEAGMQFCFDNNVAISDVPVVGTGYQVSDDAMALGDMGVLQYLGQNGIVIGTLAVAPVQPLKNDDGAVLENDNGAPLFADAI